MKECVGPENRACEDPNTLSRKPGLFPLRLLPILSTPISSTPNSSTPISSTVINFNKVINIFFEHFFLSFSTVLSYFISFSKKIINYFYQKDVFTKKTGVDEMGIDELGVDEMGVDEMGVDEMGSRQSGMTPKALPTALPGLKYASE